MIQIRSLLTKVAILVALSANLLVLGIWVFQPPWIQAIWPGLVTFGEDSPENRFRQWCGGDAAPRTVAGLISLFSLEELLIAGALLTLFVILFVLLLRTYLGSRSEAHF